MNKVNIFFYYIKHYIFVVFYFINIIFSSINIFFPLHIIKLWHKHSKINKIISKICSVLYIFNNLFGYSLLNQTISNIFFIIYMLGVWCIESLMCQIINILIIKMQSFVTVLLKFAGTDIFVYQEKGKHIKASLVKGSIVTIPNHLSELDTLYIGSLYNNYYPPIRSGKAFAKSAIRFYPFIGWLLLTSDVIFVQNRNKKSNLGQHAYIENKLKNNGDIPSQTTIFIEGITFNEKVRLERNLGAEQLGSPTYDNVLVPRTTGIYLTEKNIDVRNEIYVSMKFTDAEGKPFDKKYYDMTIAQLFFGGHKPHQVHLLVRPKTYDGSDIDSREKFNNRIFQNFKSIDETLSESLDQWSEKYDREKIGITFKDLLITFIILLHIIYSTYLLTNSLIYLMYFGMACVAYIIMGFLEHKNVISKTKND